MAMVVDWEVPVKFGGTASHRVLSWPRGLIAVLRAGLTLKFSTTGFPEIDRWAYRKATCGWKTGISLSSEDIMNFLEDEANLKI
jgi:hypothetical protein